MIFLIDMYNVQVICESKYCLNFAFVLMENFSLLLDVIDCITSSIFKIIIVKTIKGIHLDSCYNITSRHCKFRN